MTKGSLQSALEELLAEARKAVHEELRKSPGFEKVDDSALDKMGEEEKIERLALQTFKFLDRESIEKALSSDPMLPSFMRTEAFLKFRKSVLSRALELYKAIEMLPNLEEFLESGGCL